MKPPNRRPSTNRRGFALIMVIIFLFFMLSLMALTFKQITAVLRLESARTTQITNNEVDLRAAASVLTQLEQGTNPAVGGVIAQIDPDVPAGTPGMSNPYHYDVKVIVKGDASGTPVTTPLDMTKTYTVTVTRS